MSHPRYIGESHLLPITERARQHHLSGEFTAANGDRLTLEAEGTFCFSTLVATYEFHITGGTGQFANANGRGTWLVPPPATFDGVAGVGDEFFLGTLAK